MHTNMEKNGFVVDNIWEKLYNLASKIPENIYNFPTIVINTK
jgi:hypothetical protein